MKRNDSLKNILISSGRFENEKNYWLKKLDSEMAMDGFPSDYPETNRLHEEYKQKSYDLTEELSKRIVSIANGSDFGIYIILLSGVKFLLYKYSGSMDVKVGMPVFMQKTDAEYINDFLILRNSINLEDSFKEFLLQIKKTVSDANENQNYPMEKILEILGCLIESDSQPLINTVVMLDSIHKRELTEEIKTDTAFCFSLINGSVRLTLKYNASLYKEETIDGLAKHLDNYYDFVTQNTGVKLSNIDILSEDEKKKIAVDFNSTEVDFHTEKTIHRLFERQAEIMPDKIAVKFKNISLTYGELNEKSNQLARVLRKKGVVKESVVAIMMERSPEFIIGILGILKAGGAYLPIDPEYPVSRIKEMLEDSNSAVLLTNEEIMKSMPFSLLQDKRDTDIKLVITHKRAQIKDFDSLCIPDRSLVNYEKYSKYIGLSMVKNTIAIQATRGCPYNCLYCHKIWPKTHVVRSAENIFNEVKLYYEIGVRRFVFVDDIFNLDKENSTRFFNLVIDNGLKIQIFFPNGLRGDILTKEYIDLMVKAGVTNFSLALETASPRIQKLIGKNLNLAKFKENIEYIVEKHPQIILELETMHGFPTETEEEAQMTLDFIKNTKWIHFPYVHILKIYPGSDMAKFAMESGVSAEAIERSSNLAYHELPDTLPFRKSFTKQYQADFLNEYFLSKERLIKLLPYQMRAMREDELVYKYNSYLPVEIKTFKELLDFVGISMDELKNTEFLDEEYGKFDNFNEKVRRYFLKEDPSEDALKILLIDLSQYFGSESEGMLYNVAEPPLGPMYLITHLKNRFGTKVNGKIIKSMIDFDNYEELKSIIDEFKPHIIGIRTLSFYRDFFHRTVSVIRQWGIDVPIVTGGPYATSSYEAVLKDPGIDLVVMGEGEQTFSELIGMMIDNSNKLPEQYVLKEIEGLAFADKGFNKSVRQTCREIIMFDQMNEILEIESKDNLESISTPENLVYIIYTSGSTGKPKGVMLEHGNLTNLLNFEFEKTGIVFNSRVLQFASICFDVSAQEIFSTLLKGGELHLIDNEQKGNIKKLFEYIDEQKIEIVFLPTALLKFVSGEESYVLKFPGSVKHIITAGEQLIVNDTLKNILKQNNILLHNHYGPSETHVVTSFTINTSETIPDIPPIGKPISNTKAYILDRGMSMLPIGVAGELYISGASVGRGYINDSKLTEKKFLPDPFSNGKRMYKTGDLVRWSMDGELEFLGRIDCQVKVRGFRIELGEIEAKLLSYRKIKEAVVIDKNGINGEKYLCAYIVSDEDIEVTDLREFLKLQLPEYMIPSYFVKLERMPMTPTGKIQRKALPEPREFMLTQKEFDIPGDEVESRLVDIWKDVLDINKVGLNSNFFELGGHSLKATILIARIHKEFNIEIPLREVFKTPTVKGLAQCIKEAKENDYISIPAVGEKDYYPVSSAQRRLYILNQFEGSSIIYNLPFVRIIEGNLDTERLNNSFKKLIKRHEVLRTSFDIIDNEIVQRISEDTDFEICCFESEENKVKDIVQEFIRPFDLSKAPLIRVGMIRVSESKHYLMFDMHHIISDGVSMGTVSKELSQFYGNKELQELRIQYKDFSIWQNELFKSNRFKNQEEYWLNRFSGDIPVLNMPLDFPRPPIQSFEGNSINFEMNEEISLLLNKLALETCTTLNMVLLAAYYTFLHKYTDQEDIIVGTPVAGRQNPDLYNVVGMFVNTLAIRNYPEKNKRFMDFLTEVKENSIKAYENQDYQFEELVEKLDLRRDISRTPLFDTMFVMENMGIAELEIEGMKLTPYEIEFKIAKFDFILFAYENGKKLQLVLEYNTSLFKKETAEKMLIHFVNILKDIISNPDKRLFEIDIMSEEERRHILFDFNNTKADYDTGMTINNLFEEQVKETPDNIACIFENRSITYRELNERSNQLARVLRANGVTSESVVGIMIDRSFEMVIGLLAILKAGGAYLPIDSGLPEERITYMLEDAGAKVVLTDSRALKKMPFTLLQGFESNDSGNIVLTEKRAHIEEFDKLPIPDRSLIDLGKYKNKIGMASVNNCITLQTTRGCPYKCLYCHKVWSKNHVRRSAENIYSEIQYYNSNGVVNFAIIDDCFNLDMKNSRKVFELIIKNNLKIQLFFPNGLRGDILTPDYIDLMVEAGTRGINLSLETASPRLQELLMKNLDLERFKEVVNYIAVKHPGVILEMATMHGFPSETEEEALMTLNFIKDIKWIHFPYIHILKIFPNTEMEEFALRSGVSKADILKSRDRAFHELPETLPFPKSFTRKYQASFLNEYFLLPERLKQVLPVQVGIMDESALVQKYNAYLPVEIGKIEDIIKFAGIQDWKLPENCELGTGEKITIFDREFRTKRSDSKAKKIMFLDLSQHFSSHSMLYKVAEQPLGQIYLLTYLKEKFGDKIDGRIYKSGNDFDSYQELKELIDQFKPDMIGIRTLTFFKEFFHETVSIIRQWGANVPIIAGGPYASSDFDTILKDSNVDLVLFGEGEYTLSELVEKMLENDFKLPGSNILKGIKGLAFADRNDGRAGRDKSRRVLLVDYLLEKTAAELKDNLLPSNKSDNLAYVMYTSGTTGKPKGIMVEHRQVNNCIQWMQSEFNLKPSDTILQRTNLTFDPSVWEVFWPLYKGASIKLITAEQSKDAEYLINLMCDNTELTVMYCPASLVTAMTYILESRPLKPKLRLPWFIIGAEPISMETVKKFYSCLEGMVVNTYGPTECTINNTFYYLERDDSRTTVPIGKPVANNRIYILSDSQKLVPVKMQGEICIAGQSVARGYINNKEKTEESFIKGAFGEEKLYRTGDVGRWLEDGNIEIIGRADEQVKVRGYRIELGEIKSALLSDNTIKDCVVTVRDSKKVKKEVKACKKCGITSEYPEIVINEDGICEVCQEINLYKEYADEYFGTQEDLNKIIKESNRDKVSKYDCILLYSGGRGAANALYRLVEMGHTVLAVTYDNGYFTKTEMGSIKKITGGLGVDHVVLTHVNTKEILRESLRSAGTVCKGCFMTSSALAAQYARNHNIKVVIGATLSRGQIIENKLFGFYRQGIHKAEEIERELSNIQRNAYAMDKAIYDLINLEEVKDGSVYDSVKTLDFYRYLDITNEEMIKYLNNKDTYWKSRSTAAIYSTNCPIKQIGDYAHLKKRNYHYYGSATSWEKRLGHITLENVKEDLTCKVNENGFRKYLEKVGYEEKENEKIDSKYICAYITTDKELDVTELRGKLLRKIPEYMIPSYFVKIETIPQTANGKVASELLPEPERITGSGKEYEAPSNDTEKKLVEVWQEVLGVERVGVRDNFFELGGNSLKATILVTKANKDLGVKVLTITDLFSYPTVFALASHADSKSEASFTSEIVLGTEPFKQKTTDNPGRKEAVKDYKLSDIWAGNDEISVGLPIEPIEEREYHPATSAQKRHYILYQIEGAGIAYNLPSVAVLEGNVDNERLIHTFKKLVERHDSLRTSFEEIDEEIVQKIHKNVELEVACTEADESDINNIIREFVRPFDLSRAPLMRVGLVKVNNGRSFLLLDMHHIISDGASIGILMKEIALIYEGKGLAPLRLGYKDYSAWQSRFFSSDEVQKQKNYWLEKFSDEIPVLNMPLDYNRPPLQSFSGDSITFKINKELAGGLKKTALETGTTLYMVLLATYNVLLYKYTGQEDIVIGSPIAGRRHMDLVNVVGLFINTLALRNHPKGCITFKEFLKEVKDNCLKAYENQDYQFEELVDNLNIRRELSRNPLFDTMFVFQDINVGEMTIGEMVLKPFEYETGVAKFDIILNSVEHNGEIIMNLSYCTDLFKKDTVNRLAAHYERILYELSENPDIKLSDINMLSEEEKNKILFEFNNTECEYQRNKVIHRLFEEQAERTPDNIAVVFKDKSLTYKELNVKANSLAKTLRSKGVKRDCIVGIMTERSVEMIVGILGILKAGGAYLPIEPEYPAERINYILEDSKVNILLSQKYLNSETVFSGEILNLGDETVYSLNDGNPDIINASEDLMYIIYTSGTTGKPKGVMIEHRNLVRLLFNSKMQFEFSSNDVWTMFHSYCFDFSVWEIFGAILYGGKLVIVPKLTAQSPKEYLGLLEKEKVTVLNQTPTSFSNLISEELQASNGLNIRYVIFGGEKLKPAMLKGFKKKYPDTKLINMYGITETTVHVTFKEITDFDIENNISNIGKPIATTTTYIMDSNRNLQPVGVWGELYVGGDGVARGYLNMPGLTSERFLQNPYKLGETIYKSGDNARLLPDGDMEYQGRNDLQVKIRGHRIELGEIESVLIRHKAIKEATVIVRENTEGDSYLCAYIVSDNDITVAELRVYLSSRLPDYMIPSLFVRVEKMPTTSNGKVDIKKLRALGGNITLGSEYEAPGNEIEEKLENIWMSILQINKVGVNDNFFSLGGHSLKATKLMTRIHKVFNVNVPLKVIFGKPTIKELAEYIKWAEEDIYSSIMPVKKAGYYQLSSAQKRLYILSKLEGINTSYNMPAMVMIEGALDKVRFETAAKGIVKRHEAFRTQFEDIDGEPVQRVLEDVNFGIECVEASEVQLKDIFDEFIMPFQLTQAPLLRIKLVRLTDNKHAMLIDMHHIISDGTSVGIFIHDFVKLYNEQLLPDIKIQYKDFSAWQNSLLKSDKIKGQEEYWIKKFSDSLPVIEIPTDFPRPCIKSYEGSYYSFSIDKELKEKISNVMSKTGATLYMVLLGAFNVLLHKYSGQEDIIIGSPVAGRQHTDLENVVGMFVNMLAMRNKPRSDKHFTEFLREVRDNALQAYENQAYQFEEMVEKLNLERDPGRNPIFDMVLSMQNMDIPELEIDNLKFTYIDNEVRVSKFDLMLFAGETEDGVRFDMEYSTKLFKRETIKKICRHFVKVLEQAANNSEILIKDIELLEEHEKEEIIGRVRRNKEEISIDIDF